MDAIESTLKHVSQNFSRAQVIQWLDATDDYGVCLLHYVVALDLDAAIRILVSNDANVNVKMEDSNVNALVIAAARGNEQTYQTLICLGAHLSKTTL